MSVHLPAISLGFSSSQRAHAQTHKQPAEEKTAEPPVSSQRSTIRHVALHPMQHHKPSVQPIDEPLFRASPAEVVFHLPATAAEHSANSVQLQQSVHLTNLDRVTRHIQLRLATSHHRLALTQPRHAQRTANAEDEYRVAAGMTITYTVHYSAPSGASSSSLSAELIARTDRESFVIPVRCAQHQSIKQNGAIQRHQVAAIGTSRLHDLHLSSSHLVLPPTFLRCTSRQSVTLTNRSSQPLKYTVHSSNVAEPTVRRLYSETYDHSHMSSTTSFAATLSPSASASNGILHSPSSQLFSSSTLEVEPLQGTLYPAATIDLLCAFTPQYEGAHTYHLLICVNDDSSSSHLLTVDGRGTGPQLSWQLPTQADTDSDAHSQYSIGDIYMQQSQSYDLVLANHGLIAGEFSLSSELEGNSWVTFEPASGIIAPNAEQHIVMHVCALTIGDFDELINCRVRGCRQPVQLQVQGTTVGPTYTLTSADGEDLQQQQSMLQSLDFGVCSFGFIYSKRLALHNTSAIPLSYTLTVPADARQTCNRQFGIYRATETDSHDEQQLAASSGVIPPNEALHITVQYLPNSVGSLREHALVLGIEGISHTVQTISLQAQCVVSSLQADKSTLAYSTVYYQHGHRQSLTLRNDTAHDSYFEVQPQLPDEQAQATLQPSTLSHAVLAHSQYVLDVTMTAHVRGAVNLPLRIAIPGLSADSAASTLLISCQADCQGAALQYRDHADTPQRICDFGTLPVLQSVCKTLTLHNATPIPAVCRLSLGKKRATPSPFRLRQDALTIQGHSSAQVDIDCNPTDCQLLTDALRVDIVDSTPFTLPLRVTGSGHAIVAVADGAAESPLTMQRIDLGQHFSGSLIQYTFELTNASPRPYHLEWENVSHLPADTPIAALVSQNQRKKQQSQQQSKGSKDVIAPLLSVEPLAAHLQPGGRMRFVVSGRSNKAKQQFAERLIARCTAGGDRKAELLYDTQVAGSIVHPTVQWSVGNAGLAFELLRSSPEAASSTAQTITLTNSNRLPLQLNAWLQGAEEVESFSLSSNRFTLAPLSSLELQCTYQPSLADDGRHSAIHQATLVVQHQQHRRCSKLPLIGRCYYSNLTFDGPSGSSSLEFGCVQTDTAEWLALQASNPTPIPVNYSWSIESPGDADSHLFDILPINGLIAAHSSGTRMEFTYHARHSANAVAVCTVQNGPQYRLKLSGIATTSSYKVSNRVLSFGSVSEGQSCSLSFTVTNTGRFPLQATIRPSDAVAAALLQVQPLEIIDLAPRHKQEIRVTLVGLYPPQLSEPLFDVEAAIALQVGALDPEQIRITGQVQKLEVIAPPVEVSEELTSNAAPALPLDEQLTAADTGDNAIELTDAQLQAIALADTASNSSSMPTRSNTINAAVSNEVHQHLGEYKSKLKINDANSINQYKLTVQISGNELSSSMVWPIAQEDQLTAPSGSVEALSKSIDFGLMPANTSRDIQLQLTNDSPYPCRYQVVNANESQSVLSRSVLSIDPPTGLLRPQSTKTLTLTATPTTEIQTLANTDWRIELTSADSASNLRLSSLLPVSLRSSYCRAQLSVSELDFQTQPVGPTEATKTQTLVVTNDSDLDMYCVLYDAQRDDVPQIASDGTVVKPQHNKNSKSKQQQAASRMATANSVRPPPSAAAARPSTLSISAFLCQPATQFIPAHSQSQVQVTCSTLNAGNFEERLGVAYNNAAPGVTSLACNLRGTVVKPTIVLSSEVLFPDVRRVHQPIQSMQQLQGVAEITYYQHHRSLYFPALPAVAAVAATDATTELPPTSSLLGRRCDMICSNVQQIPVHVQLTLVATTTEQVPSLSPTNGSSAPSSRVASAFSLSCASFTLEGGQQLPVTVTYLPTTAAAQTAKHTATVELRVNDKLLSSYSLLGFVCAPHIELLHPLQTQLAYGRFNVPHLHFGCVDLADKASGHHVKTMQVKLRNTTNAPLTVAASLYLPVAASSAAGSQPSSSPSVLTPDLSLVDASTMKQPSCPVDVSLRGGTLTLAPQQERHFQVQFKPSEPTTLHGSLVLTTTPTNNAAAIAQTLRLTLGGTCSDSPISLSSTSPGSVLRSAEDGGLTLHLTQQELAEAAAHAATDAPLVIKRELQLSNHSADSVYKYELSPFAFLDSQAEAALTALPAAAELAQSSAAAAVNKRKSTVKSSSGKHGMSDDRIVSLDAATGQLTPGASVNVTCSIRLTPKRLQALLYGAVTVPSDDVHSPASSGLQLQHVQLSSVCTVTCIKVQAEKEREKDKKSKSTTPAAAAAAGTAAQSGDRLNVPVTLPPLHLLLNSVSTAVTDTVDSSSSSADLSFTPYSDSQAAALANQHLEYGVLPLQQAKTLHFVCVNPASYAVSYQVTGVEQINSSDKGVSVHVEPATGRIPPSGSIELSVSVRCSRAGAWSRLSELSIVKRSIETEVQHSQAQVVIPISVQAQVSQVRVDQSSVVYGAVPLQPSDSAVPVVKRFQLYNDGDLPLTYQLYDASTTPPVVQHATDAELLAAAPDEVARSPSASARPRSSRPSSRGTAGKAGGATKDRTPATKAAASSKAAATTVPAATSTALALSCFRLSPSIGRLAPRSSAVIEVAMQTTQAGQHDQTVGIAVSNSGESNVLTVRMTGQCVASELDVSLGSLMSQLRTVQQLDQASAASGDALYVEALASVLFPSTDVLSVSDTSVVTALSLSDAQVQQLHRLVGSVTTLQLTNRSPIPVQVDLIMSAVSIDASASVSSLLSSAGPLSTRSKPSAVKAAAGAGASAASKSSKGKGGAPATGSEQGWQSLRVCSSSVTIPPYSHRPVLLHFLPHAGGLHQATLDIKVQNETVTSVSVMGLALANVLSAAAPVTTSPHISSGLQLLAVPFSTLALPPEAASDAATAAARKSRSKPVALPKNGTHTEASLPPKRSHEQLTIPLKYSGASALTVTAIELLVTPHSLQLQRSGLEDLRSLYSLQADGETLLVPSNEMADSSPFSYQGWSGKQQPLTLTSNAAQHLSVDFHPRRAGLYVGELRVYGVEEGGQQLHALSIRLQGQAVSRDITLEDVQQLHVPSQPCRAAVALSCIRSEAGAIVITDAAASSNKMSATFTLRNHSETTAYAFRLSAVTLQQPGVCRASLASTVTTVSGSIELTAPRTPQLAARASGKSKVKEPANVPAAVVAPLSPADLHLTPDHGSVPRYSSVVVTVTYDAPSGVDVLDAIFEASLTLQPLGAAAKQANGQAVQPAAGSQAAQPDELSIAMQFALNTYNLATSCRVQPCEGLVPYTAPVTAPSPCTLINFGILATSSKSCQTLVVLNPSPYTCQYRLVHRPAKSKLRIKGAAPAGAASAPTHLPHSALHFSTTSGTLTAASQLEIEVTLTAALECFEFVTSDYVVELTTSSGILITSHALQLVGCIQAAQPRLSLQEVDFGLTMVADASEPLQQSLELFNDGDLPFAWQLYDAATGPHQALPQPESSSSKLLAADAASSKGVSGKLQARPPSGSSTGSAARPASGKAAAAKSAVGKAAATKDKRRGAATDSDEQAEVTVLALGPYQCSPSSGILAAHSSQVVTVRMAQGQAGSFKYGLTLLTSNAIVPPSTTPSSAYQIELRGQCVRPEVDTTVSTLFRALPRVETADAPWPAAAFAAAGTPLSVYVVDTQIVDFGCVSSSAIHCSTPGAAAWLDHTLSAATVTLRNLTAASCNITLTVANALSNEAVASVQPSAEPPAASGRPSSSSKKTASKAPAATKSKVKEIAAAADTTAIPFRWLTTELQLAGNSECTAIVIFRPSAVGHFRGRAEVCIDGRSATTFHLTGVAEQAPVQCTVGQKTCDGIVFGSGIVPSLPSAMPLAPAVSVPLQLAASSTTTDDVTVKLEVIPAGSASASSAACFDHSARGGALRLSSGQSRPLTVSYQPSSAGEHSAWLLLRTARNGQSMPQQVQYSFIQLSGEARTADWALFADAASASACVAPLQTQIAATAAVSGGSKAAGKPTVKADSPPLDDASRADAWLSAVLLRESRSAVLRLANYSSTQLLNYQAADVLPLNAAADAKAGRKKPAAVATSAAAASKSSKPAGSKPSTPGLTSRPRGDAEGSGSGSWSVQPSSGQLQPGQSVQLRLMAPPAPAQRATSVAAAPSHQLTITTRRPDAGADADANDIEQSKTIYIVE